ncbi:hypothetical protein GPECTOR_4g809 [Gonium pectorale]|uniref:Uncharacterized protein n=1 Tax=Gonium pectorale TaxID=33097 RepID=A0A150GZH9_GONPE|nr:hypothetical protein GPECTOR_4g809 [Gonium pectorale]|eukprot:KXZ54740.1 hypothetical protein GPECTOR_4g809 [Gonium pectorale]
MQASAQRCTVFGLELQARYEKLESVSVWTPDSLSLTPGSPYPSAKTVSGRPCPDDSQPPAPEIKPVPDAGAEPAASTPTLLSRELRTCRRGVVLLLTAAAHCDPPARMPVVPADAAT